MTDGDIQRVVLGDIRSELVGLISELKKMLPKNFNTMSALRQRDVTDFVVMRLSEIVQGVEGVVGGSSEAATLDGKLAQANGSIAWYKAEVERLRAEVDKEHEYHLNELNRQVERRVFDNMEDLLDDAEGGSNSTRELPAEVAAAFQTVWDALAKDDRPEVPVFVAFERLIATVRAERERADDWQHQFHVMGATASAAERARDEWHASWLAVGTRAAFLEGVNESERATVKALREALERLREWDMLWVNPATGRTDGQVADGDYWRRFIDAVLATHSDTEEGT